MKKIYSKILHTSLATIMFTFFSASASSGDIYVITSSGVTLTGDDVKDIFEGNKQTEGGVKLTPIDNASLKTEFLNKALHLTPEKYTSLWGKKVFRDGLIPPATKSSDLEIIAMVKSKPGTVGYVSEVSGDVRVITKY